MFNKVDLPVSLKASSPIVSAKTAQFHLIHHGSPPRLTEPEP